MLVLVLSGALSACAPLPAHVRRDPGDPWERANRGVFAVNRALDRAVLRPPAATYARAPAPARRTVHRFFANLRTPASALNDVLQAHPVDAARNLLRFALNTTVGLAGTLDPATHLGLGDRRNDFGRTLARWGAHEGPYLMLPLLGPSFAREAAALPVDVWADPVVRYARVSPGRGYPGVGARAVSERAELLGADGALDEAFDAYALVRDAYRQNRRYELGQVPAAGEADLDDETIEGLLREQRAPPSSPPAG